jgi:nascent polypeptide-associated complex subunit alpha
MFPGMRGMNPKQMEAMMRKMGIKNETVKATEVIIVKPGGNIHIKEPSVSVMIVQGERTWQISGREVLEGKEGTKAPTKMTEPKIKPKPKEPEPEPEEEYEDEKPTGPAYAEEDVMLVMEQARCSETEARKALEKSDGQPAEAILLLMSKK